MIKNLPALIPEKKKNKLPSLTERLSHGGADFTDFMPGTLSVTEQAPSHWAKNIIITTFVLLMASAVWATLAEVDQVIVGQGQVRPTGNVLEINHNFGGKITELLVKEGDLVEKGQVLVRLDPADVSQQINQITSGYNAARLAVARLEAEASGKNPKFPADLVGTPAAMAELALFNSRMQAGRDQRRALQSAIEQRQADIQQYQARAQGVYTEYQIAQQQAQAAADLAAKGYYPKLRVLEAERDVTSLRREIETSLAMKETAEGAVAEARARLAQFDSTNRGDIYNELTAKKLERDQMKAEFDRLTSQQDNLAIVAPAAGYIENMTFKTAGQAVPPNTPIMSLVPQGESYVVDVKIRDQDISRVVVGQKATIKLTAYDFQRYGKLDGEVVMKPTNSVRDDATGETYFKVTVSPRKNYLGDDPMQRRVQSGMAAEVDLMTGKKSVASYVGDVVLRLADEALRE